MIIKDHRLCQSHAHTLITFDCRMLKPYLMDAEDLRGPWEYIWYHVVQAFGEDRKLLGVVGMNLCIIPQLALQ